MGAGGVAVDEEVPMEMEEGTIHWDKEGWRSHFGKEANRRAGESVGKDRLCRGEDSVMTGGRGELMAYEWLTPIFSVK